MRHAIAFVVALFGIAHCEIAQAQRLSAPPSKITIQVSGLMRGYNGQADPHNGTWELTPTGQHGEKGTWQYRYASNPSNPQASTVLWGVTVDEHNQIWVQSHAGQFHNTWGVIGDVYSIGGAPQLSGNNSTFLQIIAAP